MADAPKNTLRVKMLTNIVGRPSYVSGEVVDLETRPSHGRA